MGQVLDIWDDPTEMLLYVDDELLNGSYNLYPWQVKFHQDFATTTPFEAVVCTCNGAGKDKFIIAPCAVWLGSRFKDATCVVTSASGTQLDRQTNSYIKRLCEQINSRFGTEIWRINYRHYENIVTGSVIELFVTDESGRAEGWHPKTHNSHLAIFTSESKSIPEDIFKALARCTGFTKRVDCSTPGLPDGTFYKRFTSGNYKVYLATYKDCPHIPAEYVENCKAEYGENSPLFKSMFLAEFAAQDDSTVIPYLNISKALNVPHKVGDENCAGLDLAADGDETVLAIRNGNKITKIFAWRAKDTSKTVDTLNRLLKDNEVTGPIYADSSGLGGPILWELKSRHNWKNVFFVNSGSKPRDKKAYANLGTELWFKFAKLLEESEICLPNDQKLISQLSSRRYMVRQDGSYILEPKRKAKFRGVGSPDRADAVVLAFTDYKTTFVAKPPPLQPPPLIKNFVQRSGQKAKINPLLKAEIEQYNLMVRNES